jgi:PPOX class probable F420-dependent enzyme
MSLPQEIPLTHEELHQLLAEKRLARLATIDEEGWPQVTPVWFEYRNGVVEVVSEKKSFKVRNMLRNNRVALVVDEDSPPNRSVMMKGLADVMEKGVGGAILRQAVKYLGDEDGRVYADSLHSQDFVLVRIRPVKTKTWSYR